MSVPFIELKRFEDGFLDSWNAKVADLSANTRFIGGPEIENLEATLKQECGVSHAIGCANGTDALQLALRGAGVGKGDAVLLPDLTFWATFEAVGYASKADDPEHLVLVKAHCDVLEP